MFMKSHKLTLALSLLLLGTTACHQSEIDQKPAAQVTETTTAASTAAPTTTEPAAGTTTAKVIKEKSSINFVGAKVTRDHKGKFNTFDGGIEYAGGQPQKINFDIDVNSIETDTPDLTKHLKSPDFFDVAKYPKATFTSTSLTAAPAGSPDGATHILKGTLNMHGVDREVTIPVKAQVTPDGVRTTSEFTINRHDWGISYKGAVDDLIKDNVLIKLDLLFPPPPAA
jgi:polyisoprenoid-binding protein YceI